MQQSPPRPAVFLAILVLGAYSQIVQALLVRESLVVFYGNEVGLGAFYGSWLAWIALGSLLMVRWRGRPWVRDPLPLLRLLLLVLPLLLFIQIAGLRGVRWLLDVSATEFVPLGQLFLSLSLATLPSSLVIGLAFPMACKVLANTAPVPPGEGRTVREVSFLYVYEALGALLGGVVFTFVLVRWFGVWRTLGAVALLLALVVWLLTRRPAPRVRAAALALALGGVVLATTPAARWLGDAMETLRFATLQPGLELLTAVETRYGHTAVARLGGQTSVVVDGRIAASFPRPREVAQEAAYLYAQGDGARKVLMFGGLAGGLAAELLRYPITHLDLVEQDRRAFDTILPYLPAADRQALDDPRLGLHFMDGRLWLNRQPADAGYGLVLALDAVPSSAWSNRYFTREFYQGVARVLAPDGVFCTRVASASNYLGKEVRGYTASVYRTLRSVFPYVALRPGDEVVFCASRAAGRVSEDPAVLARRYAAVPLEPRRFPAQGFYSLLPAERIEYLRGRLEGDAEGKVGAKRQPKGEVGAPGTGPDNVDAEELNTDATPVTYYLNMVLWGKFSASGFVDWLDRLRRLGMWPYVLPLGVFVLLWMLRSALEDRDRVQRRREASLLALVVLGLTAMAVQLVLLFSYQAHVGFMFGRIALLNGLFMTGLALGAGGIGRKLATSPRADLYLVGLLGITGLALWWLPVLLAHLGQGPGGWLARWSVAWGGELQESVYLGLCLGAGLLTGIGFPLGLAAAQRELHEVVGSSGLAEAADHLGGALGGVLTGALLVPLLGVSGTCRLLALLAACVVPALLYARYAPASPAMLRARGGHAFPWPRLGWLLALVVLTQFGWMQLQRAAQPGPQVRFEQARLAAVSGSRVFVEQDRPWVHYPGAQDQRDLPRHPETASLSSLVVAAEVRGYGGPINLLMAIDRDGRLRGVQYIDSRETPSYIAGIDTWLAGLAGQDLSEQGLNLERVDALSGATVTSRAVLESINRAARAVGEAVFQGSFAPQQGAQRPKAWTSPGLWATLALLLAFFPVYLSGNETARLGLQAASLVVFGLWLNTLVTEVDLVNLGQGHWASWWDNPQRWLLLGFVLLSGVLFGQVWCGYMCPFGAVQEFLSRLGRRFYLRRYPRRSVDTRLRFLKFVLLAAMLVAVWATGEGFWASFDPMQHVFSVVRMGSSWGWMGLVAGLSLVGALFYIRPWCRYLCPMGAALALFNKVALLQRFAPARRFDHCDLGVREEYDVDCIRCNRCLSGRDYGVRSPRAGTRRHAAAEPGNRVGPFRSNWLLSPAGRDQGGGGMVSQPRGRAYAPLHGHRWHPADLGLLLLVALLLGAMAAYLAAGPSAPTAPGAGGWRRIDTAAVRAKIDAGQLSDHEALWYHAEGKQSNAP